MVEAYKGVLGNTGDTVDRNTTGAAKSANNIVGELNFNEGSSMFNTTHLLADEDTSNSLLSNFGISVGDVIGKESGNNTFTYTVVGIGYNHSHLPYPQYREDAKNAFKEAILKQRLDQISLCMVGEKHPDHMNMIGLSVMISDDRESGIFSLNDSSDLVYTKLS